MSPRTFSDLPPDLQAAVTAYDEARRDLHDSYKITGPRTPAMSDANKATIAPMVEAAVSAYLAQTEWQLFETAPKTGAPILACVAGAPFYPDKVQWVAGVGWTYPCGKHGPSLPLTHWRELPHAPALQAAAE